MPYASALSTALSRNVEPVSSTSKSMPTSLRRSSSSGRSAQQALPLAQFPGRGRRDQESRLAPSASNVTVHMPGDGLAPRRRGVAAALAGPLLRSGRQHPGRSARGRRGRAPRTARCSWPTIQRAGPRPPGARVAGRAGRGADAVVVFRDHGGAAAAAGAGRRLASVALAEAIEQVVPGLRPAIKWPNDVLLDDRKVAGILAETSWDGRAAGGRSSAWASTSTRRRPIWPRVGGTATSLQRGGGPDVDRGQLLLAFVATAGRLAAAAAVGAAGGLAGAPVGSRPAPAAASTWAAKKKSSCSAPTRTARCACAWPTAPNGARPPAS